MPRLIAHGLVRLLAVIFFLPILGNAQSEKRIALVVGNSKYSKEIGELRNSGNDARDMAQGLRDLGFEVLHVSDANYNDLRQAIKTFHEKIHQGPEGNVVSLFYYAGHGVQHENENYLVPVDARIEEEQDIVRVCFPVQRVVINSLQKSSSRINIIILDACRNNPFPKSTRAIGGNNGLSEFNARGSFIAYATAPGAVASDGLGVNGLYTQELLKAIKIPGLLIEQTFKEVRRNVLRLSNEKQYTWDNSNIIGDFYFIPPTQEQMIVSTTGSVKPATTTEPGNHTRAIPKVVDINAESLSKELSGLTDASVPYNKRKIKQQQILQYFVVPYATTFVMMGPRIDERLTAEKILDRLVTLPPSEVQVKNIELSDSGRIIELSIEIM